MMIKTVRARFDGEAFYPEESLGIAPNTRVLITVEALDSSGTADTPSEIPQGSPVKGEPYSFLKFAMSLNLKFDD
jgi:hypothetical protein